MNVAMEYMYRDAGNNKLWNIVVYPNPKGLVLSGLESRIKAALIDGQWFVAEKIGIPALKFEKEDFELDHGWHEFHGLFETADDATGQDPCDIEQLVSAFEQSQEAKTL